MNLDILVLVKIYLWHLGVILHLTLGGVRKHISGHGGLEKLFDLKLSYLLPLSEKLLGVYSTANLRLECVSYWPVMVQPLVSMRDDHAISRISMPERGFHTSCCCRLKSEKGPLVSRILNT